MKRPKPAQPARPRTLDRDTLAGVVGGTATDDLWKWRKYVEEETTAT